MKSISKLLMVSLVLAPVVALSGCCSKREVARDHGMMESRSGTIEPKGSMMESKHKLERMKKEYGGK